MMTKRVEVEERVRRHSVRTRFFSGQRITVPLSVVAAMVTFAILLATYLATSAPDLTLWDAPELVIAAHTLGIPHPPGTPLWVLIAHLATWIFSSAGPARSVVLLSVWASAIAGGLGAAMMTTWIGARGAVIAMVSAGTMLSVWSNATETEVYAVAYLLSLCLLYAGDRAGRDATDDHTRARWRALMVFCGALALPLHMSALVAAPAALALAWRGRRPAARDAVVYVAIALLALSAVAILPLRAAQHPMLDSGHPVRMRALIDVLQRAQYDVAGLWPRRAPWWIQLGNVLEWADWQVAFGVHPFAGTRWPRTALSVLRAWLAVLGLRTLWRRDARIGRAMAVLLASGTLGVCVWLNLRAGPSFGVGVLPDGAMHEARERDYFFVLGFWAWGALAGAGLFAVAAQVGRRLPSALANGVLAVAAVPLLVNGPVMDRHREPMASLPRVFARLMLDAVPTNGVLIVAGDHDTFPLWYLQQVEGYRTDVSVVTASLLATRWYREQLATRWNVTAAALGTTWRGQATVLRSVSTAATAARRSLRVSVLLARDERHMLDPDVGWLLQGLVYAPSAATSRLTAALDQAALAGAQAQVPPTMLRPLPPGADAAALLLQDLLRCTGIRSVVDPLLVSTCNGP